MNAARVRDPHRQPAETLTAYLEQIGHYPVLTREAEMAVACRARAGDPDALNTLVCSNLRFVVSVAKKYQHPGVSLMDLISEGNLGLIRAARRFDETKGFKLVSYAVWWIRQAILQSLTEQGRIVRVPVGQAGALHRVNKAANALSHALGREPTLEEIADDLDLPAEEIGRTLTLVRSAASFDAPVSDEADGSLGDLLEDETTMAPDAEAASETLARMVEKALHALPSRDASILRTYFGFDGDDPRTLEQIGADLGITRERVRQIRDRALRRLRKSGMLTAVDG